MNVSYFIARRINASTGSIFARTITNIGIIAVAVSLCVLLLTSAIIAGFQNEIGEKVFGFWGHIHVTPVDSDRSVDAIPFDKNQDFVAEIKTLKQVEYLGPKTVLGLETDGTQKKYETNGGVKHVHPFIHLPAIINSREAFDGVILKGIDHEFDWSFFEQYMEKGEILQTGNDPYTSECIISSYLAKRLELDTGQAVIINFIIDEEQIRKRLTIRGIYNTGLEEYDKKFAIVDLKLLQNVLQWEPRLVSGLALFLDDLADLRAINEYVYIELLPASLYSESIRTKFPAIFEWLELQKVNENVLMIIMLIVAFINMATVVLILILDRSSMIGTLKSMGARDSTIMRIFVFLSSGLVIKGMIIGNILALLLIWLQDTYHLIKLNQSDYYLSYAPVHLGWSQLLFINAFTFVIIALFLFIPSFLISRIKPINTLKFS